MVLGKKLHVFSLPKAIHIRPFGQPDYPHKSGLAVLRPAVAGSLPCEKFSYLMNPIKCRYANLGAVCEADEAANSSKAGLQPHLRGGPSGYGPYKISAN